MKSAAPSSRIVAGVTVGILAYSDVQGLDVAGPLDVFSTANARRTGNPPYRLSIIGLDRNVIHAESGLAIVPACTIDDAPQLDTLIIPGGCGSRLVNSDQRLLAWIRARAATTRRVVSVCTGAYILAATGLLDGRRVTTHWRFASDLAGRYPALRVEPDRIFLREGRFATSGGLSAAMDLALALVEEDLGAPAALAVARELVIYLKRPGNQTQFSAPLAAQMRGAGRLSLLVDWLLEHLGEKLTLERMAAQCAMSVRHFRRQFVEAFGIAPARFVERLRLEQACVLLTQGRDSMGRIARISGFNSADAFGRAFRTRYGVSPGEYRERFGS
ncbi:MAG: GlxA family transcriptional regulator [Steroidobacteraceae bacterium]